MNYKRFFKNQSVRFFILRNLTWLPPSFMLKCQYFVKFNRLLNLEHPERFTEKIQHYKLNYRNPIMFNCVDKYLVREYIKARGCGQYLNELYGVYKDAKEINFTSLPDKFVLKTTDGGGGENVLICKDKSSLDLPATVARVNSWRNKNLGKMTHEWAYEGAKSSKIIVEKYLEQTDSPDKSIYDYKFFCFDGNVKYLVVDVDRYAGHKRNFYTVDWEFVNVLTDCPNIDRLMPRPENYGEMVMVAEKLSIGFPFVRVDLYNIANKVIFGEMTFYPWSGYVQFSPDSFDVELGRHFNLVRKPTVV